MIRRQMLRNLILGVGAWAMGRTSQAAQTPDLPPLTTPNTQFTTEWVVRLPDGVDFAWGPTSVGRMFGVGGDSARTLYFQTTRPVRLKNGCPFEFETV